MDGFEFCVCQTTPWLISIGDRLCPMCGREVVRRAGRFREGDAVAYKGVHYRVTNAEPSADGRSVTVTMKAETSLRA